MTRYCLVLFLAAGLVQGCQPPAAKPAPTGAAPGAPSAAAADDKSLADAKPDFTFTATAWHDEFKKDEGAARTKYLDKVIELTGVVDSVLDQQAAPGLPALSMVHLEVPKDSLGVRCDCTPPDLWKTVMPGSNTTVRGKYTVNSRLKGELFPCVVVKTDSKPVTVTAAALAAEVEKDPKAADGKYSKKWIFVSGKLKSTEVDKNGVHSVTLEGSDKVTISCGVPEDDAKPLKLLKPGQAVKVFGNAYVSAYDKLGVSFSQSRVTAE